MSLFDFIRSAEDTQIGERVARVDGSQVGTVATILDGAVTVEWDQPQDGNTHTHFLPSGLEDGMLVKVVTR